MICDLLVVFANIIRVAVQLAGLGLFIMLVVGGFKFLTARSDQTKVEQTKATMTYAIIGLTVIFCSWLILKYLVFFSA